MHTLEELLTEELRDLYDAEKQLLRALPKFSKGATHEELKSVFTEHTEVTRNQVGRLEQAFEKMGQRARSKPCKAMKGLVEEATEIMQEDGEDLLIDSAMIGAAQKVEHYEIAAYGTARTLAENLGMDDVAKLLQETLDEEEATDKRLTEVALQILEESQSMTENEGDEEEGEEDEDGGGANQARKASGRGAAKKGASKATSKKAAKKSGQRGRAAAGGGGKAQTGSKSVTTTDHQEIQAWAEERKAQPACVRGTGKKGDQGVLRFDFPGYSGGDSLEAIEWEEFFEKFDEQGLALLYQPQTAAGERSNFNKLIARETAETGARNRPQARGAAPGTGSRGGQKGKGAAKNSGGARKKARR
jgi:ferritin-like metal-binding protein YciE